MPSPDAENLSAELGRFVSPAWPHPKAIWLKNRHLQMYSKIRWFLQDMDYAALKLMGNANAGIAPPAIAAWSYKEVSASDLDFSKFPTILKMGEPAGAVTPKAPRPSSRDPGFLRRSGFRQVHLGNGHG
jgi:sugar (pentulose or hexulose) kinase